MGRVVHFEVHATDPQLLIAFYTALCGWKFQRWGDMDYWIITTGSDAEPGINGGLLPRRGARALDGAPLNAYVCTATTASVDAAVVQAVSLGGAVALPKMPVPGIGWLAYVKDPDGNLLGLMQQDPAAR